MEILSRASAPFAVGIVRSGTNRVNSAVPNSASKSASANKPLEGQPQKNTIGDQETRKLAS